MKANEREGDSFERHQSRDGYRRRAWELAVLDKAEGWSFNRQRQMLEVCM